MIPTYPERVALAAESQLGLGEEGRNNAGPALREYRRGERRHGAWCASFALWCLEEAAAPGLRASCWRRPGGRTMLWFDPYDWRGRRLAGAKALIRRAATQPARRLGEDEPPKRGDLIAWHRPRNGIITWRGHVGVVASWDGDALRVVEGNRGRYPAIVRVINYPPGRWRGNLFGVLRPPRLWQLPTPLA